MKTVDFSETIAANDLKGRRSRHLIELTKACEGQVHFFTIYFPGFVCFVLYWAKITGERLLDHWSSGFIVPCLRKKEVATKFLPKKAYYNLKKKCCGSKFSRFNKDHTEDEQIPK